MLMNNVLAYGTDILLIGFAIYLFCSYFDPVLFRFHSYAFAVLFSLTVLIVLRLCLIHIRVYTVFQVHQCPVRSVLYYFALIKDQNSVAELTG